MNMHYQSEPASAHQLRSKASLPTPVCGEGKYRVYIMLERPKLQGNFSLTF